MRGQHASDRKATMHFDLKWRVAIISTATVGWWVVTEIVFVLLLTDRDHRDPVTMAWRWWSVSSMISACLLSAWWLGNGRFDPRPPRSQPLLVLALALAPTGLTLFPGLYYVFDPRWHETFNVPGWVAAISFGGTSALFFGALWCFADGVRLDSPCCRRCGYDMADVPGLRCPECGRQARHADELLHARRSPWFARIACLSVLLTIPALRLEAIQDRGWAGAVPTSALVILYPLLPDHAFDEIDERLASTWSWRRNLLTQWAQRDLDNVDDLPAIRSALRIGQQFNHPDLQAVTPETASQLVDLALDQDATSQTVRHVSDILWSSPPDELGEIFTPRAGEIADRIKRNQVLQPVFLRWLGELPDDQATERIWPCLEHLHESATWTGYLVLRRCADPAEARDRHAPSCSLTPSRRHQLDRLLRLFAEPRRPR